MKWVLSWGTYQNKWGPEERALAGVCPSEEHSPQGFGGMETLGLGVARGVILRHHLQSGRIIQGPKAQKEGRSSAREKTTDQSPGFVGRRGQSTSGITRAEGDMGAVESEEVRVSDGEPTVGEADAGFDWITCQEATVGCDVDE